MTFLAKRLLYISLLIVMLFLFFNIENIGKRLYPFYYRDTITNQSIIYSLDPLFIAALIKAESDFDPNATSDAGAIGLLQIMPDTGYWIAEKMNLSDFTPQQLYHPDTNIKMGIWYLSDLNKEFDNKQILVLAAYNAGRGNVAKWIEEKELNGQENDVNKIPFPETRNYIRKVLFNYQLYKYLY